jgi:hypothetical protein
MNANISSASSPHKKKKTPFTDHWNNIKRDPWIGAKKYILGDVY